MGGDRAIARVWLNHGSTTRIISVGTDPGDTPDCCILQSEMDDKGPDLKDFRFSTVDPFSVVIVPHGCMQPCFNNCVEGFSG